MKQPEPLQPFHDLAGFDCGNLVMNTWLNERALKNQAEGATRTFVVCNEPGNCVLGYYALAAGQISRAEAPGNISRGMPDPVPMMVLARLAVDRQVQGTGLGAELIVDCVMRTLRVSEDAGVRGLLVSAIDERAQRFYEKLGFVRSRTHTDVLMMRLKVAAELLNARRSGS